MRKATLILAVVAATVLGNAITALAGPNDFWPPLMGIRM